MSWNTPYIAGPKPNSSVPISIFIENETIIATKETSIPSTDKSFNLFLFTKINTITVIANTDKRICKRNRIITEEL